MKRVKYFFHQPYGTIGVNSFYYFDGEYTNSYPMTITDAKVLALFMSKYKKKPLIIFSPLERLELLFLGKPVVKLTKQEELDILKAEENLKSMKDLPILRLLK